MRSFMLLPAMMAMCLAGCESPPTAEIDFQDHAAFTLAKYTSAPSVAPDVVTKHKRADCPTGGWVTHGDGHRTRCPHCDPPWDSAATDLSANFGQKCDNPNCDCWNCQCKECNCANEQFGQIPVINAVESSKPAPKPEKTPETKVVCTDGACYKYDGRRVWMLNAWRPVGPCLRPGCTCTDPAKCIEGKCDGCRSKQATPQVQYQPQYQPQFYQPYISPTYSPGYTWPMQGGRSFSSGCVGGSCRS